MFTQNRSSVIEVIDNCSSFCVFLAEMQIELHSPGVEIWEAIAEKKSRCLTSVALCLQLSAALK